VTDKKREEILEDFDKTITDYKRYYLEKTKQDADPRELVGPGENFEEMAEWQYNLLIEQGLKTGDTVIDVGCGVLRAGIPLIKYLEPGNYIGADISLRALLEGNKRIYNEKLGHKKPVMLQNTDLSFERLENFEADYILMQSLWTHLPPAELKQCVENMHLPLKQNSVIIVTLYTDTNLDEPVGRNNGIAWWYPPRHIQTLLNENGYEWERLDVDHPNNLVTLKIWR